MTKEKVSRDKAKGSHHPAEKRAGGALEIQVAQSSEAVGDIIASGISESNQIIICRSPGCHDISTTKGFCRLHYLASWKRSKSKEAKKQGQELKVYLAELARKFPEEFLDKLRTEVEELMEKDRTEEAEEGTERTGLFDAMEGDEDIDTIIKGLKVEDF